MSGAGRDKAVVCCTTMNDFARCRSFNPMCNLIVSLFYTLFLVAGAARDHRATGACASLPTSEKGWPVEFAPELLVQLV